MSEFEVTIVLKAVQISAGSPAEAVTKASEQVAADVGANTKTVAVQQLDRITVKGFNR